MKKLSILIFKLIFRSSKEEKENKKNSPLKSLTRAKSAKGSHHLPGTHQGKPDKKKTAPTPKQNLESSPKKGEKKNNLI